jgi:predicted permease
MMKWFHAARARLRLLAPRAAETRIDDELRFHIEMETEKLVREQQLDRNEAHRRAMATFGGVQQHRETLREGRGTAWFTGLSLDLKLGFRMLAKYPGLTIVGGLAMAFGIWFGAVTFEMFGIITNKKLPLPDSDRIVRIESLDLKTKNEEERVLYEFQFWRRMRSLTDVGAYRDVGANLVGANGSGQPAIAAEISASAFRIAPTRPLHGRVLNVADERAGAAPVVVLGYDLWQERFDGDPRIIGRNVQIGANFVTVVGVMPDGFAFPVAHELWLPLRADIPGLEPRVGGDVSVFGRLAPGATFETAQAEVASIGKQLAAEHPATHAQIQPHVLPYAQFYVPSGNDDMNMVRFLTYMFVVMLVAVVCCTVALLLFARAASRENEIIVRSALGASRRRIVTQLFAEALVLAGVAAAVGLVMAQVAITNLGRPYLEANMPMVPFWFDFNLSPSTIANAIVLAVIGAMIAGVLPARKITRGLGTRLRAGTAGGGGVSFGGVWTAVIVTQVALTVAFPAVVMLVRSEFNRIDSYDFGFPAQEYLAISAKVDGPPDESMTPEIRSALDARYSASMEALRRRLETEPGVAGATFINRVPGGGFPPRRMEVLSMTGIPAKVVPTATVHPSYFDVMRAPILSGRGFNSGDLSPDARVVIVDQGFVDVVMGGVNPVGHRIRLHSGYDPDSNAAQLPWYEIIGVVKELGTKYMMGRKRAAGVYLPAVQGTPGVLMVHGRGDPLTLAPRIREIATAVDPTLRIHQMIRVDKTKAPQLWFLGLWVRITGGITLVALVLSLAGIYAVLSYIVARRTREIGVRVALGAGARRVITSIFRKPLTQVAFGVLAGVLLIGLGVFLAQNTTEFDDFKGRGLKGWETLLLGVYGIMMLGVCLLACVVPTLRALRVQPTEALRAE